MNYLREQIYLLRHDWEEFLPWILLLGVFQTIFNRLFFEKKFDYIVEMNKKVSCVIRDAKMASRQKLKFLGLSGIPGILTQDWKIYLGFFPQVKISGYILKF